MENTIEKEKETNSFEPIDVFLFKKHIRLTLMNILDSLPKEKKQLIIDKSCIKKLDFFSDFESIQQKNVEKGIVKLDSSTFDFECKSLIYIIPPKTECLGHIKVHFDNHRYESKERQYFVIFLPKIDYICQKFIENNNLSAEIKVFNLNIDVYPLDYDLLSLEESSTLEEVFVNKNYNILAQLNRVIMKFEAIFGKIKYKYAKGSNAKRLKDLVVKEEANSKFNNDTEILGAMFFDRSIDFITPFCSQGTYEGVLDERFNIQYNYLKIPPEILEKDLKKGEAKVDLSHEDKFFTKIKTFSFHKIRVFLSETLKEHDKILARGKETTDLTEIQNTLVQVKILKEERSSLINHINIASVIGTEQITPKSRLYNYIEQGILAGVDKTSILEDFINDEISKRSDPFYILKLICLYSTIQNGFNSKLYFKIKREFMNSYGYEMIFLWMHLEKLGILKQYQARGAYEYLVENLKLLKDDVKLIEPNDCAYAFGGYCPIIVRLIEKAITTGWNNIKNIIQRLPDEADYPIDESEIVKTREHKNFILLVFIGGITYSEIDAIRYLSTTENLKKYKFIILTTSIIHGKRLLKDLMAQKNESFTMKDFCSQLKIVE